MAQYDESGEERPAVVIHVRDDGKVDFVTPTQRGTMLTGDLLRIYADGGYRLAYHPVSPEDVEAALAPRPDVDAERFVVRP